MIGPSKGTLSSPSQTRESPKRIRPKESRKVKRDDGECDARHAKAQGRVGATFADRLYRAIFKRRLECEKFEEGIELHAFDAS